LIKLLKKRSHGFPEVLIG